MQACIQFYDATLFISTPTDDQEFSFVFCWLKYLPIK